MAPLEPSYAAVASPSDHADAEPHPSHPSSPSDYAAAFAHAVENAMDGVAEALQGVSADLPSPMELERGENRQHPAGEMIGQDGDVSPLGEMHSDELDWEQVCLNGGAGEGVSIFMHMCVGLI